MSYFLSLQDIIFETSDTFDPFETTVEVQKLLMDFGQKENIQGRGDKTRYEGLKGNHEIEDFDLSWVRAVFRGEYRKG